MAWLLGIVFFVLAGSAFACILIENVGAKVAGGIGGAIFTLLFIFVPFSIHQVDAGQVASGSC